MKCWSIAGGTRKVRSTANAQPPRYLACGSAHSFSSKYITNASAKHPVRRTVATCDIEVALPKRGSLNSEP